MKRAASVSCVVVVFLLMGVVIDGRPQATRPHAPMLTNDDVVSPRSWNSLLPDETITQTGSSGTPLRNARGVLESALLKMAEVNSLRIRMEASLPAGQREILIESVKPDRAHVISPEAEMIVIGRKFYLKSGAVWKLTSMPGAQSDAGFDFRTFVKQTVGKSGVRITGQILGEQTIDGVDAIAYEFAYVDGSESGAIQLSVGKDDGYMRRMSLFTGAVGVKAFFTHINEQLSIEPPM